MKIGILFSAIGFAREDMIPVSEKSKGPFTLKARQLSILLTSGGTKVWSQTIDNSSSVLLTEKIDDLNTHDGICVIGVNWHIANESGKTESVSLLLCEYAMWQVDVRVGNNQNYEFSINGVIKTKSPRSWFPRAAKH